MKKLLLVVSLGIIVSYSNTAFSDGCQNKHKATNFQQIPESSYAFYDFNSHFIFGSKTTFPSYQQYAKAEPAKNPKDIAKPNIRGVADFNLDGFEDLVVGFHETEQIAAMYYSDSKGGFCQQWLPGETRSKLFREASIDDFMEMVAPIYMAVPLLMNGAKVARQALLPAQISLFSIKKMVSFL